MKINVLAVGDVVGRGGLDYLARHLRSIIAMRSIDFTVVNGENVAVNGLTPAQAEEIFDAGADVITLGNHTWGRKEIIPYLDESLNIIRPLNYAPQVPGRGFVRIERAFGTVLVVNLLGRFAMDFGAENPFLAMDQLLADEQADIILVDFHAEGTGEKLAMGHYLDGRVSVVWGTHTHVQTSDATVLPKGSGYVTDIGMTGPIHSVLGVKPEQSISMFLGNPRSRFEAATGKCKLECAIFTVDTETGKTEHAEVLRIHD
ncbi:MAG: TIGR00282 family metallophosphoesterase [Oscillospiraceae bacterium]|nr:TIGR00282 family metallophosphoesterase [Oscillospiraceae bacterium]